MNQNERRSATVRIAGMSSVARGRWIGSLRVFRRQKIAVASPTRKKPHVILRVGGGLRFVA